MKQGIKHKKPICESSLLHVWLFLQNNNCNLWTIFQIKILQQVKHAKIHWEQPSNTFTTISNPSLSLAPFYHIHWELTSNSFTVKATRPILTLQTRPNRKLASTKQDTHFTEHYNFKIKQSQKIQKAFQSWQ